jgi:DNA-binding LacI/PurR family transcriptional regulator
VPKGKILLSAVAKRARTSLATASLVLNGRGSDLRIAPETSERIRRAAKDLGYRSSHRSSGKPAFRTIGVVFLLPGRRGFHEHFAEFYLDLACELGRRGCLICTDHGGQLEDLEEALAGGPLRHADGLVFAALTDVNEDLVGRLDGLQKPYVLVNRRSQPGRPCVTTDNEERGYRQALKLYRAGHQRIAFFDMMPGGSSQASTERYLGVLRAARENGLAEKLVYADCEAYEPEALRQKLFDTLGTHPEITGLVFSSMNLSSVVMRLLAERGVAVPRKLSVVACDTSKRYMGFEPRIDSIVTPTDRMGREVAGLLLELMQAKPEETRRERTVIVPGEELPAKTYGRPGK